MSKIQQIHIKPDRGVCLDGGDWHGWLFVRHVDGAWVSFRKLETWEVMQAEDQLLEGIVTDGGHNVVSRSGGARCG